MSPREEMDQTIAMALVGFLTAWDEQKSERGYGANLHARPFIDRIRRALEARVFTSDMAAAAATNYDKMILEALRHDAAEDSEREGAK